MSEHYRPLPESLTIKQSSIEGLGLFAVKDIPADVDLGVSHRVIETSETIRTPLGGFYNHSKNPNCVKEEAGNKCNLITTKEIKAGEELTVDYTFYNVDS